MNIKKILLSATLITTTFNSAHSQVDTEVIVTDWQDKLEEIVIVGDVGGENENPSFDYFFDQIKDHVPPGDDFGPGSGSDSIPAELLNLIPEWMRKLPWQYDEKTNSLVLKFNSGDWKGEMIIHADGSTSIIAFNYLYNERLKEKQDPNFSKARKEYNYIVLHWDVDGNLTIINPYYEINILGALQTNVEKGAPGYILSFLEHDYSKGSVFNDEDGFIVPIISYFFFIFPFNSPEIPPFLSANYQYLWDKLAVFNQWYNHYWEVATIYDPDFTPAISGLAFKTPLSDGGYLAYLDDDSITLKSICEGKTFYWVKREAGVTSWGGTLPEGYELYLYEHATGSTTYYQTAENSPYPSPNTWPDASNSTVQFSESMINDMLGTTCY